MRAALLSLALLGVAAAGRFSLQAPVPVPSEWQLVARASADSEVSFVVALTQQNLAELDSRFWSISTPGMPLYGQFMTTDEVNALVGSSEEHMAAALSTFNGQAGIECTANFDALNCVGTVAGIESLFQTELYSYSNVDTGRTVVVHTGGLTLPQSLSGVVVLVEGFSRFPVPTKIATHAPSAVDYVIAPESVDAFIAKGAAKGSNKIIQSVAEFQAEPAYTPAELATFSKETGVPTIVVAKKIGPFAPGGDPESSLDIQYISSVGTGNTNWFITEADWLYSFATQFNQLAQVPSVISMSYGWYEGDQCSIETQNCTSSYGYVERVNVEFQKLGVKGISLLASSGDSGAHGRTDAECSYKVLRPAFPAASPYVTAVGATMIKAGTGKIGGKSPVCTKSYPKQCALGGTQIVASTATGALITSGGGFSNVAPRPAYQEAAVKTYLADKSALPPAANFNESGRGFPDVTALGHNYFIEAGGALLVDGTSCSAPVWGGILGLLNAFLEENTKPLLGFANPTLYAIAAANSSAFIDITEGDNTCTEDTCAGCSPGFKAVKGWDASSGLGAPNFPVILDELAKLKGL